MLSRTQALALGRDKEAEEGFERCLELNPEDERAEQALDRLR